MDFQNYHGWMSWYNFLDEILLRALGLHLELVWIHFRSLQRQVSEKKI